MALATRKSGDAHDKSGSDLATMKNKYDNNPPHRDIYISRLRDALNLYFPVCGSTKKSSLGIIPQSHRWMESDISKINSPIINGYKYNVDFIANKEKIIRHMSNNDDEFLLFSPYIIHGGAPNFNDKSHTRISLEIRFWRKDV